MKIIGWGIVAALLFPALAYSQRVLIGGKVSGQINNPIGYPGPDSGSSEDRILFGPMMEVHATHGMAVEFDALYSRFADVSSFCCAGGLSGSQIIGTSTTSMHSWQLPLIGGWPQIKKSQQYLVGSLPNTYSKCFAAHYQTAPLAAASTGSPIASRK